MKLLPRMTPYEQDSFRIIDTAVREHGPSRLFAGLSGGKDSTVTTHLLSRYPGFSGAFHANTGIGIEDTRDFVREWCLQNGWPLTEIRALEDCGQSYEDLVTEWGFPGPAHHWKMYQRLKERPIRKLKSMFPRRERILLATGVRHSESRRRMGRYTEVSREGRVVWCNPIVNWTAEQRNEYADRNGVPACRASNLLCMSGECLCGAFAKPNEKEEIRLWFPETAARLDALEQRVAAAGQPNCSWGKRPIKRHRASVGPFCWSCEEKLNNMTP